MFAAGFFLVWLGQKKLAWLETARYLMSLALIITLSFKLLKSLNKCDLQDVMMPWKGTHLYR